MGALFEPATPARAAETLLILLPGAYDTPQELVHQGFAQAVQQRQLPVDLCLVDAHTGYYTGRDIVASLHRHVVRPARAQGYRRVWLSGISLGGYGALLFARQHASLIDGVFVMAAFLGRRDLPAAIAAGGGLLAWDGELAGADTEDLALWRWLRQHGGPPLWLGYGEDDRFAMSNRLLAAALPPARVLRTPGGHDWAAWRRLWGRFLDARPWAGTC